MSLVVTALVPNKHWRLQEVTDPGQERVRHIIPCEITTSCFYTSAFVQIKQDIICSLISFIEVLVGGFCYRCTKPG